MMDSCRSCFSTLTTRSLTGPQRCASTMSNPGMEGYEPCVCCGGTGAASTVPESRGDGDACDTGREDRQGQGGEDIARYHP